MFRVGSRRSARAPSSSATDKQLPEQPHDTDEEERATAKKRSQESLRIDTPTADTSKLSAMNSETNSAPDARAETQRKELAAKRTAAASWIAEHCDLCEPREVILQRQS